MSHRRIVAQIGDIGVDLLDGEAWIYLSRDGEVLSDYAVSSCGRAVSLPRTVLQGTRGGGVCDYRVQGRLLDPPLERVFVGGVSLAHAVLSGLDRPRARWNEKPRRRNGNRYDCRISNLLWEGDLAFEDLPAFAELAVSIGPTLARRTYGHSASTVQRWQDWVAAQGVQRGDFSVAGAARFWAAAAEPAAARLVDVERRRAEALARALES